MACQVPPVSLGVGWGGKGGGGAETRWRREILDASEFPVLFAFSGPVVAEVERVTPGIIFIVVFYLLFLEIIKGRKDFSAGAGEV